MLRVQALLGERIERAPARAIGGYGIGRDPRAVDEAVEVVARTDGRIQVADIERACEQLREQSMMLIAPPVPAVAFGGRRIAWLMDGGCFLVELVEAGPGPLCLANE